MTERLVRDKMVELESIADRSGEHCAGIGGRQVPAHFLSICGGGAEMMTKLDESKSASGLKPSNNGMNAAKAS